MVYGGRLATPRKRLHAVRAPEPAEGLVEYGRGVLETEAAAIRSVVPRLGAPFARAVEMILGCAGHVAVTGMGKPGFIAQKISATLASTGTPSFYLHPAEALHGDLGRVTRGDLLLALSNSGETEELVRLAPAVKRMGTAIIAVTGAPRSTLARQADVVLDMGPVEEACPMGLAPTTSAACLLAIGDALAMTVLWRRPFREEDFARVHPGGKLGQKFLRVADLMRTGAANPVVLDREPLWKAVVVMTKTPGRPGATSVIDRRGKLVGIFTDGDLRRLAEKGSIDFSAPVRTCMGKNPRTVTAEMMVTDAAAVLRSAKIDQVPVVDAERRPVGLLDVQDLLAARIL